MVLLVVVGVLCGICASIGIGGGFVLLLYLCVFTDVAQLQAQFMNLCVFIPVASISLFLHNKNKLIVKELLLKIIPFGIIGVVIGSLAAHFLSSDWLLKIFAIFILIVGIIGLFPQKRKPKIKY
ncbi:MAG: sulfite exporter TauE/SafE family protein [Oscillospiraceae bacterium]